MNDSQNAVKFGADCFSQHTDWSSYLDAMVRAEELGYDSLWTPDHVLPTPPSSDPEGRILEPFMCLSAVASQTSRATLGLLVSPISLRHPTLMTKMITTLDHISAGRAVLGVGAGWAEEEHLQYGFRFGTGFGERLGWLREALPVMRGMLDGTRPSAQTDHFDIAEVINSPRPIQEHLPILIGGSGPKVTLRLVAEFGDMCNVIGTPDRVAELDRALIEHCENVGRDPAEIERTVAVRQPIIRDTRERAQAALDEICTYNDLGSYASGVAGTPDDLVEHLSGYIEIGYRHLIFQFLAPYDRETMELLVADVRPALVS
jgi:alkanesulfonate monooxygenase SsuD/methylene tetrahydromethanopterin reductase-like flavin-dependent oxidoreductase (luciferase family)